MIILGREKTDSTAASHMHNQQLLRAASLSHQGILEEKRIDTENPLKEVVRSSVGIKRDMDQQTEAGQRNLSRLNKKVFCLRHFVVTSPRVMDKRKPYVQGKMN